MDKSNPDLIRQTLASLRQATATVDEIHDRELPADAPASMHEAFERAADRALGMVTRRRTSPRAGDAPRLLSII